MTTVKGTRMAPGNNKKRITAEVLDRLIADSDYRVTCVEYELTAGGGKEFREQVRAWPASVKLLEIAVAVKASLAQHGITGLDGAMDERGKILDAWIAVRDYLNGLTIPDSPYGGFRSYAARSNWSIPPTAHPAQGIVGARMVRCAIMQVYAPFRAAEVRQAEDTRKRIEQESRERERRADAERAEKQRKAKEKREQKEASRRGTCGVEFAGSSMRFSCDNETVFMYRHDVRRVFFYAETNRLAIVDAMGTEFFPELTGDAGKAAAEVNDWRWRASEEWENRGRRVRGDDYDDVSDDG